MHWLGAYDSIAQMMTLWHEARVKSLDDLKNKDFVVGSFAKTHLTYQWAMLTKVILGTKYKVTTGYPSRQPSQPRDGARRGRRLDRVMGEHRRRAGRTG